MNAIFNTSDTKTESWEHAYEIDAELAVVVVGGDVPIGNVKAILEVVNKLLLTLLTGMLIEKEAVAPNAAMLVEPAETDKALAETK